MAGAGRRRRRRFSWRPNSAARSPSSGAGKRCAPSAGPSSAAAAARPGGHPRGAGGIQNKLSDIVAEEAERNPGAVVEVFVTDEHRIGLKSILRRVWVPRAQRPVAHGHHRFQWLYVTAFVSPATGESFWYLGTGVDKGLFDV